MDHLGQPNPRPQFSSETCQKPTIKSGNHNNSIWICAIEYQQL